MILTGSQIRQEVLEGNIIIDPFNESRVNPNSYNYSLGDEYRELGPIDGFYDTKGGDKIQPTHKIPAEGLTLLPGHLYLCNTRERLGSKTFVTSLIGKSSMGRLGLFLQASADLGHQGEIHRWTLELSCCIPIKIYSEMVIGQVTFWLTLGERLPSNGYYSEYDVPIQRRDGLR